MFGAWQLDSANATPTGITIDPSQMHDVRVVDRGTDKIYPYNGGATLADGTHKADAVFHLPRVESIPRGLPPRLPYDVNNDRMVTPRDALMVLQELTQVGVQELGTANPPSAPSMSMTMVVCHRSMRPPSFG